MGVRAFGSAVGGMLEVDGSFDGLVRFFYVLGDDSGLSGNGHEVCVTIPTGHDVEM